MSVTIRAVRADEALRLRELRLRALAADPDAFGSTLQRDAAKPDRWWQQAASDSQDGTTQRTFVAENTRGDWVGMAVCRPSSSAPGRATLSAMWVCPAARGQRIARRLCNACADWAAARGFHELRLGVVDGNQPAIAAYHAAGFRPAGTNTWTGDGRAIDEVLFARPLTPGRQEVEPAELSR